ncbi:phage protein [Streptococcus dysgalactiae subsp. equisimilis]|nr:phage protein [Streptococcus dysgalactiae subsp. equisimilis]
MTLVDDFYKQMEPSIKTFLDDNIIITDPEEADRVYKSVKYYKKLNRLPPPNVLDWFKQIYTTEKMVALIKQSYRLKQKRQTKMTRFMKSGCSKIMVMLSLSKKSNV